MKRKSLLLTTLLMLAILVMASQEEWVAAQGNSTLPVPELGPLSGTLVTAQTARSTAGAAPPLRLQAGSFVPGPQMPGTVHAGLLAPSAAAGSGTYLIQFAGRVGADERALLRELGAEVLAPVPEHAYKVRLSAGQAARAAARPEVRWVGAFLPEYKRAAGEPAAETTVYRVLLEEGASLAPAREAIGATGASVLRETANRFLVAADGQQVLQITAVPDVAWLEPFTVFEPQNDSAGALLGADAAALYGYDGRTQIVAVADTGLGDGTPETAHRDIPASRITAIHNWPGPTTGACRVGDGIIDDGARDVSSGHGTHVSGSVLSGGGPSGEGRGTAPGASLVFQAVENYTNSAACRLIYLKRDKYVFLGLPDDLRDLFQQAYDDGARIHANSWGSSAYGLYTSSSSEVDDFIWSNPEMTITFAAGNDGDDPNNDGVVDPDSIISPATAKNALVVGASESARPDGYPCDDTLTYFSSDAYQSGETCASMGGANILGTGSRFGFNVAPLSSDPTAGNTQQMAPFSSRGPTNEGRIKPDVVAPGTWVLSTYSGIYRQEYDSEPEPLRDLYQYDGWGMPYDGFYKYNGGTSMANPLVAGAAAVVRDFYQQVYGFGASAALVKATLINSATDLLDENNDGVDDNDFPIPNIHEGWGLVNLRAATDDSHDFSDLTDPAVGLTTGLQHTYSGIDVSGTGPFKVTLVWSDYASDATVGGFLINTLVLRVRGPNGESFLGNDFSGGWSQEDIYYDGTNNVQNVFVQSPAAGAWDIDVIGVEVLQGAQTYALVVDDVGLAPGRVDVSGQVALQGHPSAPAATVALEDDEAEFPVVRSSLGPGGTFYMPGVLTKPGGSGYQLTAVQLGYLGSELSQTLSSGSYNAGPTELKGGDANHDGLVNILDLGCLGSSYLAGAGVCGGQGTTDLNGDGQTDILDLGIAGGNYGLTGLQPW